ncbi:ovarian cancer G-protein coupled receptor 1-like [Seriola aureovittata]|uniref:ovarian cancer G-protein coupled receptor 1-like n=1 Tax=Seriola aureovittata TaxID=2871759 RepID=UPI0024BEE97C|nr:ovarian cancer G-protein coupled receptor 1-like [Seriola aureovittata]
MEDSFINITSQNRSYDDSDYVYDYEYDYYDKEQKIMDVVKRIIICIGLPLILVAIYGVCSHVRNDHMAPIFIINLLISDLIQLCCMIVEVVLPEDSIITTFFNVIYFWGLMASVGFMMCVALERYLVITLPLWYRFRRTIKTSVVVCVMVWTLSLFFVVFVYFLPYSQVTQTIFGVFLLFPFPLYIFFLGGTVKALSAAISVPADEKRRIVAILVLVLLIYTVLFLPPIIWFLVKKAKYNDALRHVSFMFVKFSPLADVFLYVFSRKGAVDKLLASLCRCRMDSDDSNRPTA